ncbi:uncharacterized protein LOC135710644 [Ochlerotatus camptorhynchus]|uniref:uncharacterized protein LOC135710644 n=1 Tax=Ochlerotatus camptorhynchus TaxID=644619 RepID=UPI0031DAF855
MVELMEEQPEIARGFARFNTGPHWEALAVELNSIGQPTKEAAAWKKVWFDWKSNTKRKLAHNRREQAATGGGPSKLIELTPLEERVVVIGGLAPTVEGIEESLSFGYGQDSGSGQSTRDNDATDENSENQIPEAEYEDNEAPAPKKRKTSMHTLLETQVNNQTKFQDAMNNAFGSFDKKSADLAYYSRQISKRLTEMHQTMKQTLQENMRHNLEMERITLEKLQVKKRFLEIELNRL